MPIRDNLEALLGKILSFPFYLLEMRDEYFKAINLVGRDGVEEVKFNILRLNEGIRKEGT